MYLQTHYETSYRIKSVICIGNNRTTNSHTGHRVNFPIQEQAILHLKRTSRGRRVLTQFTECNQILQSSAAIYESHSVVQFTNRPSHGKILYYINL